MIQPKWQLEKIKNQFLDTSYQIFIQIFQKCLNISLKVGTWILIPLNFYSITLHYPIIQWQHAENSVFYVYTYWTYIDQPTLINANVLSAGGCWLLSTDVFVGEHVQSVLVRVERNRVSMCWFTINNELLKTLDPTEDFSGFQQLISLRTSKHCNLTK